MRRSPIWATAVVVMLGFCRAAASAGDDDDDGKRRSAWPDERGGVRTWFRPWFASPAKPPDRKVSTPPKEPAARPAPAPKPAVLTEAPSAERSREQTNLVRRLQACDRLLEIALETGDSELERLAKQLDERARCTYAQRIAHLPCGDVRARPDERILDRHLGPASVAGGRLGEAPTYTATTPRRLDEEARASERKSDRGSRAAAREELP